MAITWGSYQNNSSGNGMRLGYEFSQSPSSVGSGTSSVTVTVEIWVETKASVSDSSNSLSVSGSWSSSGAVSISHGSGGGTTKVRTLSRTVSTSYSGNVYTSFTAELSGINAIPGTASVSGQHTTARRPYQKPAAPSNVSLSLSGDHGVIRWTRRPTSSAPYDSIELNYQIDNGSWEPSATLSGGASSYTTSTFLKNRDYQYRVRARNSSGVSSWAYSNTVHTPPDPPAAPSNANVTRSSDTRHVVSWTRGSSSTASPITQQEIRRWDKVRGEYITIATVSGTVSSFTDSTTRTNQQYRYAVRSKNASGTSSFAYTPYISTTPAPPTNLVAKRQGADVRLTWSLAGVVMHRGVEVWITADGVDGASRDVLFAQGTTSWTHISPDPTKTYQYRLKTGVWATAPTETGPDLWSAFSARSNVVQLLAPPASPTKLSPSAKSIDALDEHTFSWLHNPIDTTSQTAYEMQYRVDNGSWVSTGKVLSADEATVLAAGTFTNGTVVEWQVRTWGDHANPSSWSAIATVTMSSRPAVTIIQPDGSAGIPEILSSSITAEWSYFDAEDTTQTSVRIRIDDENGSQVWSRTLNMASTSYDIPYTLADKGTYTLSVSVRDTSGLWSYETSQEFTVSYLRPPVPTIGAVWDLDMGGVIVNIEHPSPLATLTHEWDGVPHASQSVKLENSVEIARNYFQNPSFENDLNGSALGSTATGTLSPDAYVGSKAMLITDGSGINRFAGSDAVIPAGYTYIKASVMLKRVAGSQYVIPRIGTRDNPTSGAISYQPMMESVSLSGDWQLVTVEASIPATTQFVRVIFYGSDSEGGSAYTSGYQLLHDAYCLMIGSSPSDTPPANYFDGSTANVAGEVVATSADLQHSADGEEWETIAAGLEPTTSTVDFVPVLDTVNYYRVVSYSDMPSSLESPATSVSVSSEGWVFVNGGPDWSVICRIRDNVETSQAPTRAKTLNHFAGRRYPVMTSGEARTKAVTVSGRTSGGGSTDADWQALYDDGEPVCYREPGPAYGGSGDRFIAAFQQYGRSRRQIFEEVTMTFEQVEEV